jgi:hypothetical protein
MIQKVILLKGNILVNIHFCIIECSYNKTDVNTPEKKQYFRDYQFCLFFNYR